MSGDSVEAWLKGWVGLPRAFGKLNTFVPKSSGVRRPAMDRLLQRSTANAKWPRNIARRLRRAMIKRWRGWRGRLFPAGIPSLAR